MIDKEDSQARNALLIVATLIAAVTFQAVVNPPGGVWQEDSSNPKHKAGSAVYSGHKKAFFAFLSFNTLAFSASLLMLIHLTTDYSYRFEVWVATSSMFATYVCSVFAIAPGESLNSVYLLIIVAAPFIIRPLIIIYQKLFPTTTPTTATPPPPPPTTPTPPPTTSNSNIDISTT